MTVVVAVTVGLFVGVEVNGGVRVPVGVTVEVLVAVPVGVPGVRVPVGVMVFVETGAGPDGVVFLLPHPTIKAMGSETIKMKPTISFFTLTS